MTANVGIVYIVDVAMMLELMVFHTANIKALIMKLSQVCVMNRNMPVDMKFRFIICFMLR